MKYLAQMISNIKVGLLSRSKFVVCKRTKLILECLNVIYELGFISGFSILNKNLVIIYLKYVNNKPAINFISFSSVKQKSYLKKKNFSVFALNKNFNFNFTYLICSTSRGVLTSPELVLKNLGGLFLFKIS